MRLALPGVCLLMVAGSCNPGDVLSEVEVGWGLRWSCRSDRAGVRLETCDRTDASTCLPSSLRYSSATAQVEPTPNSEFIESKKLCWSQVGNL